MLNIKQIYYIHCTLHPTACSPNLNSWTYESYVLCPWQPNIPIIVAGHFDSDAFTSHRNVSTYHSVAYKGRFCPNTWILITAAIKNPKWVTPRQHLCILRTGRQNNRGCSLVRVPSISSSSNRRHGEAKQEHPCTKSLSGAMRVNKTPLSLLACGRTSKGHREVRGGGCTRGEYLQLRNHLTSMFKNLCTF